MKISFITLGCPKWDLDTICQKGREYGFDGVDFRGYRDELDITKLALFTTQGAETKRRLDDAGLAVSGISSSIKVCEPERKTENIEEAKRTIELAKKLGCEHVRRCAGFWWREVGRIEPRRTGENRPRMCTSASRFGRGERPPLAV